MSLKKVLKMTVILKPLLPDAPPKACKTFEKLVKTCHHLSGLIYMHTAVLLKASRINNAQPNCLDPKMDNSKQSAEAQYNDIIKAILKPSLLPKEWLQPVPKPNKGTFQQLEQQAFHLIRGYLPANSADQLGKLLDGTMGDPGNLSIITASIKLKMNPDPTAQLHACKDILHTIEVSDNIQLFLSSVICSIHCLHFATEWAILSNLPGGCIWKTK
ncbi:hypothetical protein NLJ89_g11873 [Agrocybe chaxingu]|uniref:Uncharacterized protein n=1 Tax=Agrocybe chaxingu TaxID=84603 RepID=A0A9W8JVY3_9AGAR|nr:hypothetical protein NLJ89_g11873 [Agrocybe chaxingu]